MKMIRSLTYALILLTAMAHAQPDLRFFPDTLNPPRPIRIPAIDERDAIGIALMFIGGFADGTAEMLKFNYKRMDDKWHIRNDQYWNPEISWQNKWKNGNPAQGEAFWGSSRWFVATTDQYHAMRWRRNQCVIGAIVLNIGEQKVWWRYLLEAVWYYLAYTMGFNLAYEVVWN